MRLWNTQDFSRFENFNILETSYKSIGENDILVAVLYPKSLKTSPQAHSCPVIFRIHGGGLVTSSNLSSSFFGRWILDLAEQHSAVIVSPNYRLLPESSVPEVIDDIEDAWKWLRTSLPALIERETNGVVTADVGRVILAGESAGGYLGLQLALSHPEQIRSVTAAYPAVDVGSSHFCGETEKIVLGVPLVPRTALSSHIEKVLREEEVSRLRLGEARGKKTIVTSDPGMDREALMLCMVQHGLWGDFFPANRRELFPLCRLEDGARFPRGGVVIWHGGNDSVVPVSGSVKLKEKIQDTDPELKFRLVIRDGEEHAFDSDARVKDQWISEALKDVVHTWLS